MYKLGWKRFVPFLVTILGVVFIDLLKGISLGMLVAIITIIPAKLSAAFSIIDETQGGMKKLKMVFSEKITFFNKRSVYNSLEEIEHGTELIIDMKDSSYIDSDVSEMIDEFIEKAEERDIKVSLLK